MYASALNWTIGGRLCIANFPLIFHIKEKSPFLKREKIKKKKSFFFSR